MNISVIQFVLTHAWLIPLLPALAFVLIGLFLRRFAVLSAVVSLTAGTISFVLSAMIAYAVVIQEITIVEPFVQRLEWVHIEGLQFMMGVIIDPLSALMLVVVSFVSLLVQIYSVGYMKGDLGLGRFFAYVSLFSASMLGLNISINFIQMYIFWELVGLCSYLLIGFYYYKDSAKEAAKKAFITTRIGDFGLLLGILLLQAIFGTTDFIELQSLIPMYITSFGTGALSLIGFLLFIGPIGKSGQFPLHVWLPDAMEGPTPVSALIHAATMVVAGVYLIARAYFLFVSLPELMSFIAWLGAFTAFFGASIALSQYEIKRILAYSTISQLGYMMLALGVGSLTASMFHLMTHAFFKALLFLCAGVVMHAVHDEANIFKMGGLRRKLPLVCLAMTIGVLSIAGIPPFSGFFSKDEILLATAEVSMPLYLLATLTAFMTAFYMARLLFVVFWGKEYQQEIHLPSKFMTIPLVVLSILAVISGFLGYVLDFGTWIYFASPVNSHIEPMIAVSSTILSLLAFTLAWSIYGSKKISANTIANKFGYIYKITFHKYYIDEFYAKVRALLLDGVGKIMYFIDLYLIDGIVNGLSVLAMWLSNRFSKLQSGQAQRGVAVFLCGVIVLLIYSVIYFEKIKGALLQGGAF